MRRRANPAKGFKIQLLKLGVPNLCSVKRGVQKLDL